MTPWKVANVPEEAGLSSRALLEYLDALEASGMEQHSVMVIKNGMLAASIQFAPHSEKTPHVCYSISKLFTSAAAGFAVAEKRLSWNDRVIDVLREQAPENPDEWLSGVTLHHLLCMGSGLVQKSDNLDHIFSPDTYHEVDWAKVTLAYGCDAQPGSVFRYNSHGSYLISCMVQKAVGMNIRDYLYPRLFEPLGIALPRWDMSPQGICCGGWGLYLSIEDMAKFGYCLLMGGKVADKQVLPKEWLDLATQKHIPTNQVPRKPEWSEGYGYHIWRCTGNRFRGDGSNGQYIIVSPDQNMVLAATADVETLSDEFDLFNEYIFNDARQQPGTKQDQMALCERLKHLCIKKEQK